MIFKNSKRLTGAASVCVFALLVAGANQADARTSTTSTVTTQTDTKSSTIASQIVSGSSIKLDTKSGLSTQGLQCWRLPVPPYILICSQYSRWSLGFAIIVRMIGASRFGCADHSKCARYFLHQITGNNKSSCYKRLMNQLQRYSRCI